MSILRWSARISSIAFIGFGISLRIGLHIESSWSNEYMFFTVFAPLILYIIGLVIGVWREGLGGLISLVSLAFGIIFHAVEGTKY